MRTAVIFDMDGTLANVSAIRHHVRKPNRNFDAFHAESVNCPPNEWVATWARTLSDAGHAIIIVTARKAKFRNETAMWLAINEIPNDILFMRGNKDGRPDVDVKRDILNKIRQEFNPILAFDDNPSIIELWVTEGIETITVEGWEE